MRKVLVLENYKQTLAVTRSLDAAGWEVHIGIPDDQRTDYDKAVNASASVSQRWIHPDMSSPAFAEALVKYCQTEKIDAIFPVGEPCLPLLDKISSRLPAVVTPAPEIRLSCLDKVRGDEIACQAGLPVPASSSANSRAAMDAAVKRIGRPCVIKSADGLFPLYGQKAWILTEDMPLPSELFDHEPGCHVLVQRFAPGRRHNCMFLAVRGKLTAYFEEEVLRTTELNGTGLGTSLRSVAPSAELVQHVEAFIRHLDYDGPGCVQFLVENGSAYFLECNPRLDATVELAIHCGIDFPRLALEARVDPEVASTRRPQPYQANQRMHWLLGDIEGGLKAMLAGNTGVGEFLSWQGTAAIDTLRSDHPMIGLRSDPKPAFVLLRHLCNVALRKITGRQRRSPRTVK